MAFTTYSELKTTIANYLARSDLTSVIPDFIRLAETRLQRDLRIRQMLVVATASTTGGDSTLGLPTDFLEMRDIHLNTTPITTLRYKAPNSFYQESRVTDGGKPIDYTILSDSTASNVFLAYVPDALLYASLAEAEPYLMNDARVQTWASLYSRAIDSISTSDQASEYSGQPMSMSYNVR